MKTTGRMMLALLIALVLTANMVSVNGFAADKVIQQHNRRKARRREPERRGGDQ